MAGSSTSRGYGVKHRALRNTWAPRVEAGEVHCCRCGKPIVPGQAWDLGHVDGSGKQEYAGPEHASCNRSAGAASRGRKESRPAGQWSPDCARDRWAIDPLTGSRVLTHPSDGLGGTLIHTSPGATPIRRMTTW